MTVTPEAAADADLIVERLVAAADEEDQPNFLYLVDEGQAVLVDLQREEPQSRGELRKWLEMVIARLEEAGTQHARHEDVADRLSHQVAERLDSLAEEIFAWQLRATETGAGRLPHDPSEILAVLPREHHAWFLADYRRAHRAAGDPKAFAALEQMLRKWRIHAEHLADPARQAELETLKRGESPEGSRSWSEVRGELQAQGRVK